MQYRMHQGIRVSEIGLGCYGLGGAYGIKNEDQYVNTLRAGYEHGVTFFDTAEAYGKAERVLGKAVAPFRRKVRIATKVGVREGTKPNLSTAYIEEACERSLSLLATDYIDLYQVHFDDPETPVSETIEALERLKQDGKILHYGLGHVSDERIREYLDNADIFSVLVELSAVGRDALRATIPLCRARRVGVIGFSVTGRGILTGGIDLQTRFADGDIRRVDPLFRRERFASALRVCGHLAEIAGEYGRTTVQVAIAWVLSIPGVVCALTGPSNPMHLVENLDASGFILDARHLREIETILAAEDTRLSGELAAATREILTGGSVAESATAVEDMIYAAESAIQLKWAEDRAILPVFRDLLSLRGEGAGAASIKGLHEIQRRLAETVRSDHLLGRT